ncbi:hypothetical protein RHSIM_Rhsim04G0120400 [Rhododendron simsii]|uniref:Ribonuclease H1 N-terminal domain-containing protein n=1 Tax=Rhododendron simsii TaxID=118357 RepID=A0A834LRJ7_RHOSS|nr:hypothetical protein RHSIM_Rhsim04G0120400 [Rhododendron simsii]
MKGKKFYVVFMGRNPGIYDSWATCSDQVIRFPGAVHNKFASWDEAYNAWLAYTGQVEQIVPPPVLPSLDDAAGSSLEYTPLGRVSFPLWLILAMTFCFIVVVATVSLSAFSFLFSELVQYNQTQVDNITELERRLEDAGYSVGARVLELLCHREKVADSLEKGTEHEDEYMISEKELLVNRFISIPKDMGTFNCGAFVAGIVRGVLDSAGFPAVVSAHFVPVEGSKERSKVRLMSGTGG